MYNFRAIGKVEKTIVEATKRSSKKLNLRSCHLSIIPTAVYSNKVLLDNLIDLDLSNNELQEIPSDFWFLAQLEVLNLKCNKLSVIDGLQRLQSLNVLDLSYNNLKKIPSGLTSLRSLRTLNLSSNSIIHFDRSLLLLPNLEKLSIKRNPIKNLTPELCQSNISTLRQHFKLGVHYESPKYKALRIERIGNLSPKSHVRSRLRFPNNFINEKPSTEVSAVLSEKNSVSGIKNDDVSSNCLCHEDISVSCGKFKLTVPAHKSQYEQSDYKVSISHDQKLLPSFLNHRTVLATPVVAISPHGLKFHDCHAEIHLPISVSFDAAEEITCWHSDTNEHESPNWKECSRSSFKVDVLERKVIIYTDHFSLFCAILSKPYPESKLHVENKTGADISVPTVPGVGVSIPKFALEQDSDIKVKVLFDDGEYGKDLLHEEPQALATPVVKLEPSGLKFQKPVTITLPIPDCQEIVDHLGMDPERSLTVWCSQTENLEWKEVKTDYEICVDEDGLYQIKFPVDHFSWYRALWSCMAKTIHQAKLGCAYYYPSIQFSMMCKAMLDYQPGSSSFGIEILCHRSDQDVQEPSNLKSAGGSLKPKMVKTGDLLVKLKSSCFEADVENGEEKELMKYEFNFKGYEFEKQFACLDRKLPRNRGVFGKVFVERIIQPGVSEPLFEFNLTKKDGDSSSIVAVKEVANVLNIDNKAGWSAICRKLDLSMEACRNGQNVLEQLFAAHQSRGGTSDRFMEVMYEISRSRREEASAFDQPDSKRTTSKLRNPVRQRDTRPITPEDELMDLLSSGSNGSIDGLLSEIDQAENPASKRKRPDDVIDGCALLPSKRQCVAADDVDLSSSTQNGKRDILLYSDETEFDARKLWSLSEAIVHKWRVVARNLELAETEIICLEQKHGSDFRECAYQMLLAFKSQFPEKCTYGRMYQGLCECGLKLVAQKFCVRS